MSNDAIQSTFKPGWRSNLPEQTLVAGVDLDDGSDQAAAA
jgi:hypothetical protein